MQSSTCAWLVRNAQLPLGLGSDGAFSAQPIDSIAPMTTFIAKLKITTFKHMIFFVMPSARTAADES